MKKFLLSLFVALIAIASVQAQQISVVSPGGATTLHRTFQEAINGADPGSVIYLPGGGFSISDDVKITKKLTIIGIGHYVKSGNVDGVTTISGNLWFNEGSSGSAVMGCYITGNIYIGDGGASVNDVLIRYCNLNSVQVTNNTCMGIMVNQNYVREASNFQGAAATITNNIMRGLLDVRGGVINNNIFTSWADAYTGSLNYIYDSIIKGNVISGINPNGNTISFENNSFTDNLQPAGSFGDNGIILKEGDSWGDVFVNWNNGAISPNSDFHLKDAYNQYSVGIYAGTGFNDQQMAPVPYIVAKHVDEQTNASGKLIVKIRVKANQ